MKHRAAKLLLFLLLGAIINIAFAWGLSLLIDPFSLLSGTAPGASHTRDGARIVDNRYWYANVSSCFGAARMSAGVRDPTSSDQVYGDDPREIVPRWWDAGWYRDPHNAPPWVRAEARGWPMLSMWHEVRYRDHAFRRGRMQSPGGIELPLS